MRLSVIIPVYNEKNTISELLRRVQETGLAHEIVIVDDGSYDGTREILSKLDGKENIRVILHTKNQGKGAAIRTGLENALGDILLIQDADLEYDPAEYKNLLKPIASGMADVVYGSRFLGEPHGVILFWNMVANKILTFMTNILYNNILTDMRQVIRSFGKK